MVVSSGADMVSSGANVVSIGVDVVSRGNDVLSVGDDVIHPVGNVMRKHRQARRWFGLVRWRCLRKDSCKARKQEK